jgi:hypothetical protein
MTLLDDNRTLHPETGMQEMRAAHGIGARARGECHVAAFALGQLDATALHRRDTFEKFGRGKIMTP